MILYIYSAQIKGAAQCGCNYTVLYYYHCVFPLCIAMHLYGLESVAKCFICIESAEESHCSKDLSGKLSRFVENL